MLGEVKGFQLEDGVYEGCVILCYDVGEVVQILFCIYLGVGDGLYVGEGYKRMFWGKTVLVVGRRSRGQLEGSMRRSLRQFREEMLRVVLMQWLGRLGASWLVVSFVNLMIDRCCGVERGKYLEGSLDFWFGYYDVSYLRQEIWVVDWFWGKYGKFKLDSLRCV